MTCGRNGSSSKSRALGRVYELIVCLLIIAPSALVAQTIPEYSLQGGTPAFTTADSFPNGIVNVANGNLHLEIPLGSYPQRGGSSVTPKLTYDSKIWAAANVWNGGGGAWSIPISSYPTYSGIDNWSYTIDAQPGFLTYGLTVLPCNNGSQANYELGPFLWTDSSGTARAFPLMLQFGPCPGQVLSGDAYAVDGSGYHLKVTLSSTCGEYPLSASVTDVHGTSLTLYQNCKSTFAPAGMNNYNPASLFEDSNGNFRLTPGSDIWTFDDTVGRPFSINSLTHIVNSQNSAGNFQLIGGVASGVTAFEVSGVEEAAWSTGLTTSLVLPDGSSYKFTYDCDSTSGNPACSSPGGQAGYSGVLTSITYPTGGTINFTYAVYVDLNGNASQWVRSRSIGGGTWVYSQTGCGSGCQQVTVTKPSGDESVYSFTLNQGNAAWLTSVMDYTGPATSGVIQKEEAYTYQLYTTDVNLGGFAYVHPKTLTTYLNAPGGLIAKQTSFAYDSFSYTYNGNSYTGSIGKLTSKTETGFGSGSPGSTTLRSTSYAYWDDTHAPYKTAGIVDRVSDVTISDTTGKLSETMISYDTTTLTGVNGIFNHDDSAYGISNTVRGNATLIQRWVSGSTYVPTTLYYDTTGQLVKAIDVMGNSTFLSYLDNYYKDSGDGPNNSPQTFTAVNPLNQQTIQTNAFPSSITLPGLPAVNLGNYYGTSQPATRTDANGNTTTSHYFDADSRLTSIVYPDGGWKYSHYASSQTAIDSYQGITGAFSISGCTGCVHTQINLDPLGRILNGVLVSDPDGATTTTTQYDSSGRVNTVTNPSRVAGNPTDGVSSLAYDGLGRTTVTLNPDGSQRRTYYGNQVSAAGGLGSQQCAVSVCGMGYPILQIDEAGKMHQSWQDALGRLIEVDDPAVSSGSGSSTASTGTVTLSGTEGTSGGAPGTGSSTASGSEQSVGSGSGTHGTGSVTISGTERTKLINTCPPQLCKTFVGDTGSVSITVNGVASSIEYGYGTNTSTAIATALATAINGNASINTLVSATAASSTVTITAKQFGSQTNYTLSASSATDDLDYFTGTSFPVSTSGSTLTGGTNGTTYDTGSVWVTVNGTQTTVSYGQSSTTASLASALVSAINGNSSLPISAALSGSTVNLTAKTPGTNTDYTLTSGSSTSQPGLFSHPSFSVSVSGSTLTGGINPVYDAGTVWVAVNGYQASVSYGQGSTSSALASSLVSTINAASSSPVSASLSGSTITLTSKATGANTSNYALVAGSSTSQTPQFSQASFTPATSGSYLGGGSGPNSSGTPGSLLLTINGTEQSVGPGHSTGSITMNPTYDVSGGRTDSGTISLTVGTFTATTTYYESSVGYCGGGPIDEATLLAALNSASSPVTAYFVSANSSGCLPTSLVLTAKQTGVNYPISTSTTWDTSRNSTPGITFVLSGNMIVGGPGVSDSGVVTLTVNGTPISASYGQASTASSVAASLTSQINGTSSSPVAAWNSGASITLVSKNAGSVSDMSVSGFSASNNPSLFGDPSFDVVTGSTTLQGGTDTSSQPFGTPSVTTYVYTGNQIQVNQGSQTRTTTADGLGRTISTCVVEMGASSSSCGTTQIYYTTSSGGSCTADPSAICRTTDPAGVTTTFTYDNLSRLTGKTYSDSTPV